MKKRIFIFAACAFILCGLLNLAGKLWAPELANTVKPALLPILSVATMAALVGTDNKRAWLLIAAQLFGCAGDMLLLGSGFAFFAGGMVAFLIGHIFYITLFKKSYAGLKGKHWAIAIACMAAFVAALILLIGVKGALLGPMCVYGSTLAFLIFTGVAGVTRKLGKPWVFILIGALLFTFSDAQIALDTFGTHYPCQDFVVMLTYLAAQALLAIGSVKLLKADA